MQVSRCCGPAKTDEDDALRLQAAVRRLVRSYMLLGRADLSGYGLSLTQCHALLLVDGAPATTMADAAARLFLKPSTATRIVDQLVRKKLVRRYRRPGDRRFCCVGLTADGRALVREIQKDLLRSHREMLSHVPRERRPALLEALESLTQATEACC